MIPIAKQEYMCIFQLLLIAMHLVTALQTATASGI